MVLKKTMLRLFTLFMCLDGIHAQWHPEDSKNSHVIYPTGKPRIPHLLCCQRFAVSYYGFTFGALNLQYPRLLQR